METVELGNRYWDSDEVDLREDSIAALSQTLRGCPRIAGHAVFQTSGSSGQGPRWVAISKTALRASAEAVNARLGAGKGDIWMLALPTRHVGGFGVLARASLSGAQVIQANDPWCPRAFVEGVSQAGATLSSLVPTQLFDLVEAQSPAPSTLRAGPGGWRCVRWAAARSCGGLGLANLGFLRDDRSRFYRGRRAGRWRRDGVAATVGGEGLVRRADRAEGRAPFSGYITLGEGGEVGVHSPLDSGGWFPTGDLGQVIGRTLLVEGRASALLKIVGELVDLDLLQAKAESAAGPDRADVGVFAVPDPRRGSSIVLAVAEGVTGGRAAEIAANFTASVAAYERPVRIVRPAEIPRSSLSKIRRDLLSESFG